MSTVVTGSLMGLCLGMRHALEPDHLAAVGACVCRRVSPKRAVMIGALWGAGHSASILVFGAIFLAMRASMPPWIDAVLEFSVGVMLLFLGYRALRSARDRSASAALSVAPGSSHLHAFGIGVVHGAAGTGGATVLATGQMGGVVPGIVFLAVFGLGSVLGMALIAGSFALPASAAGSGTRFRERLLFAAGLLSIGVGAYWMLSACVVV